MPVSYHRRLFSYHPFEGWLCWCPEALARLRRKTVARTAIVAHCISCVGEDWEVHSEPVRRAKTGLIVYTAKDKAIATGTGRLDKRNNFLFSLATLYHGITNKMAIS